MPRRKKEQAAEVVSAVPAREVPCKVFAPNVWTSKGKFFRKATVILPVDEARWLESRDQVVVLEA